MSTILFVDDHHAFRTVLSEVLRNAGHTVLEAATALDAERIAEHHSEPVDLLVVEAVMTALNGIQVVKRLHSRYPYLPVLMISELPEEKLRVNSLLLEETTFLSKYAGAEQLTLTVRQMTSPSAQHA
jgi:DNA-binding NtrC family response regulator